MPDYKLKLYRGRWYVAWSDSAGRTQRAALRTANREEAERSLIDFKRDMAAPPGALVGQIVGAYLDEKEGRIVDVRRLRDAWRRAEPTFGHLRPDQVTRDICRGYTELRRAAGMSDGTILKEINVVRQGLNYNKVPGAVFEAPSAPPPRDRHLTREEFATLLDSCVQPHLRLFMALAISTAGRKSALLELKWSQIDFKRRLVHLNAPSELRRKKRASVPMTDRLFAELTEANEARQTDSVIEYLGKPVGSIKTGFYAAIKRAGLEGIRPHDLRHSAAVWMAEDGVPMSEIAQFLGHSNESITFRVYARFSPTHLRKAAKSLEF